MKKIIVVMLFLAVLTYGCSPATELYEQPLPQETVSISTETEVSEELFIPTIITQTPAKSQMIPTPTATSTPLPKELYIFKSSVGEVDATIGSLNIKFHEDALKGVKISTNFVTPINTGGTHDNTSDYLSDLESGIGVLRADTFGNLLLNIHSGYYKNAPLEAEPLRYYLEEEDRKGSKIDKDDVLENILKSIDSKGTLTLNGVDFEIVSLGGVRLEHAESEELVLNPEDVLEIATRKLKNSEEYIALGNAKDMEKLKGEDSHELLISFCGWGPDDSYDYYRYVIALEVIEITTPVNQ